jgi:ABC-type antimicrobial peptide transport system permease subunit
LVVGKGLRLVAIGLVIGLIGALGLGSFIGSVLHGVTPSDPLTMMIVAGVIALTGLLACYLPGLRGTRVDPIIALRSE